MMTTEAIESKCDVLVIGAGPAGMMLGAWMARYGVNTRIVDKRSTKVHVGQADGLNTRSLEIFDSLGLVDRVQKEANFVAEMCMWNPGKDGTIQRSDRIPQMLGSLSRFKSMALLHQGYIERFFLDDIKERSNGILHVERATLPESLHIAEDRCDDHSAENYPITVQLRYLNDQAAASTDSNSSTESNGSTVSNGLLRSNLTDDDTEELIAKSRERQGGTETVRAKYVVGCDGAHSWTRRQLGFGLEGESTDSIWGVLDIIPITDFPDVRSVCTIHSAASGSLMIIPRERKLVRVYIQLTEVKPGANGRTDRSRMTPAVILEAAQRIIAPYSLTYEYCEWWTAYQIGQRVGTKFDYKSRVFLAGDAVHTHSPKAGQGMNVSMQDTFNLGWKLGLVVKGEAHAGILKTYGSERRAIAQELIVFDQQWSRMFSGRPAKDVMDEEGISAEGLKQALGANTMFITGLSVDYGASMLVAKRGGEGTRAVGKQELARNMKLGMRMASYRVVNQSDGRVWELQHKLASDGRFRIIVFAGNVASGQQQARVQAFCRALAASPFVGRYLGTRIAVLTCHSAKRSQVELLGDLPSELHRFDRTTGWDYDAVYVDDGSDGRGDEGCGHAYSGYGVDRETGCVVVTRPDQHVGHIESVDAGGFGGIEAYLQGVLVA